MRRLAYSVLMALVLGTAPGCSQDDEASELAAFSGGSRILPARMTAPVKRVQVVARLPHDRTAYTEGLYFQDGLLYEGTGLEGASDLRVVEASSGKILKKTTLAPEIFGEGITVRNGRVYQLTYQNGAGYVYDEGDAGFTRSSSFAIPTEGWGLTHDERYLIRSDGSERIYFLDPDTYRVVRTITVKDGTWRQKNLNELEYVNGAIYANIWLTSYVAKIDPRTGKILAWYDASELARQNRSPDIDDVLNGIAFNPDSGSFYLAGKRWASLYEVTLP